MHPFEDITVAENAVGIHWFGQSSFGLKDTHGTIVQVDPYFPRERPPERYIHARPPLHEAALRTDFILLTHNHGDHTCIESINRIRTSYPEVRFIGPEESIQAVREAGIEPSLTTIVSAGDSVKMGAMQAHTVWAKPPQGLPEDEIKPPDVTHLGYVVEVGQVRVYVSGDPVNTFGDHEELLQPVRQLKPDIGLLTTHPNEGEFPYFDGSAKIASALGLKAAVPAHYSCFVRRHYDAQEWATHLQGVKPLIIPYNQSISFSNN
ncbi:MAG: L-ascorbate metabolism protein UlaG (beta-lactamase superfamily) [Candidatus Latescibacterota bacterium]|jgi:L-ascorbate metabolism protein UlaG (beta-lactamase superfamily)